jgi:hypothetical protein
MYEKLLSFVVKTPEDEAIKKLVLFTFNSLNLTLVIFTRIAWGHYASDPSKFVEKVVAIAVDYMSDSDIELLPEPASLIKGFMLEVFGQPEKDPAESDRICISGGDLPR